ncbi:MAG: hypothetical protein EOP83_31205 [Verrucomicrobiaceae bacterium]|nr:MAG: hypothetical protein EOP83_31205 [Verrucomicrobiaceae bacterium]
MEDQSKDYVRLGQCLDRCSDLDVQAGRLFHEGWNVSSPRHVITMGFCRSALEHATSQRLLIGSGQTGTAIALIRLHYETTIRAAWVVLAAKQKWITNFTAPVPVDDLEEPTMGPSTPAMLKAIEHVAPDIAHEGNRLYATVDGMHSFVHGGVHLVVHGLRGYPPGKLVEVLWNRNLLVLMLCNVIVVASGKTELHGTVSKFSQAYADVMPPPASATTGG